MLSLHILGIGMLCFGYRSLKIPFLISSMIHHSTVCWSISVSLYVYYSFSFCFIPVWPEGKTKKLFQCMAIVTWTDNLLELEIHHSKLAWFLVSLEKSAFIFISLSICTWCFSYSFQCIFFALHVLFLTTWCEEVCFSGLTG